MTAGYDVIGDVHGQIAKLEGLLGCLGYRCTEGTWAHPEGRTVVFVGDIIDRGLPQRRTIELVRSMVDSGSALIILGNHEWNAMSYATWRDDGSGDHLRRRTKKNFGQHEQFLSDYAVDSDDHADVIDWFRTLPMWLELDGLRVVHACWSDEHIDHLRTLAGDDNTATTEILALGNTKGHPVYDAIEVVLKGPEVGLPEDEWYLDKEANLRRKARYSWWSTGPNTLAGRAHFVTGSLRPDGTLHTGFSDSAITGLLPEPVTSGDPVIVGHYWFNGQPKVLSSKVACVDYSAAKGGPLVAYRWSGEAELTNENFCQFPVPDKR